jgi:hypothetical protein
MLVVKKIWRIFVPLKKESTSLGTPSTYFPLDFPVVRIEDRDLKMFQELKPEQRIKWLLMIQKLIRLHYRSKGLRPFDTL